MNDKYDYIVESFFAEYKLDVESLTKIQQEYRFTDDSIRRGELLHQFKSLYPEFVGDDINHAVIPKIVSREILFIQSPKKDDGLPLIHYSLCENLLSDFRKLRSDAKRSLAEAERRNDIASVIRFNSSQLAFKVLCNSLYGAGNNSSFATYNPDIAAGITFASRMCISYLTSILGASELYVDEEFIRSSHMHITPLIDNGVITIEEVTDGVDLISNRHLALRRLFDDFYDPLPIRVYKLNIKPSTVIYQDTDSNYYKNQYVIDKFTHNNTICDPEIIDECMHLMQRHNDFISMFTAQSIARRPIGMGFEGAYIICRYMPRKKKYYGIKWGDDDELHLSAKIPNSDAYVDDVLIDDYSLYWKPKQTVLPLPNGNYIQVDQDKLLRPGVNYLDYVNSQNVKCTGVDLARRDQYRFINLFHIMILQSDLRLMKYCGGNKWDFIMGLDSIHEIIVNLMDEFQKIIRSYRDIVDYKTDKLPSIHFKLEDFAKSVAYKPEAKNVALIIVERLRKSNLERLIPPIGTRVNYVTIIDDKVLAERLKGNVAMSGVSDRAFLLEEIYEILYAKYPEDEVMDNLKHHNLNLSYNDYINAAAIVMLDFKYYMMKLGSAVSLYTIDSYDPELTRQIDEGLIPQDKVEKLINDAQIKIAKQYIEKYFPTRARIRTIQRNTTVKINRQNASGYDIATMFSLDASEVITQKSGNIMRDKIEENISLYMARRDTLDSYLRKILYNSFQGCPDGVPMDMYNKYKDNINLLESEILECNRTISKLEYYKRQLPKLFKLT